MILAIYTSLITPINLAFQNSQVADLIYLTIVSYLIDAFFLMDVMFGFFTSYLDRKSGEEEFRHKKIAINYLKTTFLIDFLSCLPFLMSPFE